MRKLNSKQRVWKTEQDGASTLARFGVSPLGGRPNECEAALGFQTSLRRVAVLPPKGGTPNLLRAFTLMELLLTMGIIGILASLMLPALAKGKTKASQITCLNNLRQSGIGFHIFAHDHGGAFPMRVSTNYGGSMEFTPLMAIADEYHAFGALSNELGNPRIFVCPLDTRTAASNFAQFKTENVSYFIGTQASINDPMSVLAGDRNVISSGGAFRWRQNVHGDRGSLLISDGHVDRVSSWRLTGDVGIITGGTTARLDFIHSPAPSRPPRLASPSGNYGEPTPSRPSQTSPPSRPPESRQQMARSESANASVEPVKEIASVTEEVAAPTPPAEPETAVLDDGKAAAAVGGSEEEDSSAIRMTQLAIIGGSCVSLLLALVILLMMLLKKLRERRARLSVEP